MQTEVSYRLIDMEGFVLWKPVGRFVFLSKGLAAISIEGYKSEKQSYKIVWYHTCLGWPCCITNMLVNFLTQAAPFTKNEEPLKS